MESKFNFNDSADAVPVSFFAAGIFFVFSFSKNDIEEIFVLLKEAPEEAALDFHNLFYCPPRKFSNFWTICTGANFASSSFDLSGDSLWIVCCCSFFSVDLIILYTASREFLFVCVCLTKNTYFSLGFTLYCREHLFYVLHPHKCYGL